MSAAIRCNRCRRRMRRPDGWNVEIRGGAVAGYLCSECQSPEENAEAAINEAIIDYGRDVNGNLSMIPKASA